MLWIKMVITCYRFIVIPSLFTTITSSIILLQSGTSLAFLMAIWTKGVTAGLLLLYVHFFRSSQFFFFNNLGFSNRSIYVSMITIDFLLAIVSFSLVLILS